MATPKKITSIDDANLINKFVYGKNYNTNFFPYILRFFMKSLPVAEQMRMAQIEQAIRINPELVEVKGKTDPFPNLRQYIKGKTEQEIYSGLSIPETVSRLSQDVLKDIDAFFFAHPYVEDPSGKTEFKITQEYGQRPEYYRQFGLAGHEGLDIGVNENMPVYAPFDGEVVIAGDPKSTPGYKNYGNWVRIRDRQTGEMYDLAHLNAVNIKEGIVNKGELLGLTGNTGLTTGPHLHLNYWNNQGQRSNPRQSPLLQAWVGGVTGKSIEESNIEEEGHSFYEDITKQVPITQLVKETPEELKQPILSASKKYGIPSEILSALLKKESSFKKDVIEGKQLSPAGAKGIAQFTDITVNELARQGYNQGQQINPFNANQAIDAAAYYLRQQYETFGNWQQALASYNAGPTAVKDYSQGTNFSGKNPNFLKSNIPPFTETENYVADILKLIPESQKIISKLAQPTRIETPRQEQERAARTAGPAISGISFPSLIPQARAQQISQPSATRPSGGTSGGVSRPTTAPTTRPSVSTPRVTTYAPSIPRITPAPTLAPPRITPTAVPPRISIPTPSRVTSRPSTSPNIIQRVVNAISNIFRRR